MTSGCEEDDISKRGQSRVVRDDNKIERRGWLWEEQRFLSRQKVSS